MNTIYIDCNKANSADKNNVDNSVYTTELKNSLTLPTGSQISIQSSFLNQKGITGESIEIEEDITETIKFFYYKSDTADLLPAITNAVGANPYQLPLESKGNLASDTRMRLFDNAVGKKPIGTSAASPSKVLHVPATVPVA